MSIICIGLLCKMKKNNSYCLGTEEKTTISFISWGHIVVKPHAYNNACSVFKPSGY